MPCYLCASEFSIIRKELGCEWCGFSFCSKCCEKREILSKAGESKKVLICKKCYESYTNTRSRPGAISPPLAYKRRIAAIKTRSCSLDSGSNASDVESGWMNEKDKELAKRLQKLRKYSIKETPPSEDDIAERLAKLKDMDPSKYKAPPIEVYRPPDMRTSVGQACELMKQVKMEIDLESQLTKPEDEIAARLAKLRNQETDKTIPETNALKLKASSSTEEIDIDNFNVELQNQFKISRGTASSDLKALVNDPEYKSWMTGIKKENADYYRESDDDEEAKRLVEKFLSANTQSIEDLDDLNNDLEESSSKNDKDSTEELPWCVICSENAQIRCFGCDSDIYCMSCFKEFHDSVDIKDHKTCPYLFPKFRVL